MTNVIARHDRDKAQTMQDYKKRLSKKFDEIEDEEMALLVQLEHLGRDRSKILNSFFRWIPSRQKKLARIEELMDELDTKRVVKLRILGSIKQKLRAIP